MMNRLSFLFAIVLLGCGKSDHPGETELPGKWEYVSSYAYPGTLSRDLVCFNMGDSLFIGLGDFFKQQSDTCRLFTEAGWELLPPFPGRPRTGAIGFSIGGKAYIGMGTSRFEEFRDFWVYDSRLNTWDSLIYDFPGEWRSRMTAFSLQGKGYVGTGTDGLERTGDFYEFDPLKGWREMPEARVDRQQDAITFVADGAAYLCFGTGGITTALLKFLPEESRWISMAPLTPTKYPGVPRTRTHAFVLHEKEGDFAYFIGGKPEGNGEFWQCCRYDPRKDSWEEVKAPDINTSPITAFSTGSKGYLLISEQLMLKFTP